MKKIFEGIHIKNLIFLLLAGIINAIGITCFLAPVDLFDSGISGTSMLLGSLTPDYLGLSFFLLVLNIPLFFYGYKKQGNIFTVYSIFSVCVYSAAAFIINNILPIDVASCSPIAKEDLLLCAIFGGLISGIGSGLVIRFGGAIDGIDVLAVIFSKRIGITVGSFIMIYNVILYIIIGMLFGDWIHALYSIITFAVALKTIDFIVDGLDKAKAATIITLKENEVCRALSKEFGSGITIMEATGFYSSQKRTVIYFVVNRFQIGRLKRIVKEQDAQAFISITEISEVLVNQL